MAKLWSSLLLALASLCVVHTSPLADEKHTALIRAGYEYIPDNGYYRLEGNRLVRWAEARRNCQQEGATLAVVNSLAEATVLEELALRNGLLQNATVHIGFHDLYIEGEYLTIRNEPIFMAGFVRWKPGYPLADENNNCGAFDINKYILDNPCDQELPYICEIPGQ